MIIDNFLYKSKSKVFYIAILYWIYLFYDGGSIEENNN